MCPGASGRPADCAAVSRPISFPPIVAGFFMPFLCGGSSGVLSGLFFGCIICHLLILSDCLGYLVPSRNRQRITPLLQGLYRACAGRFPGVASCTTSGTFARPASSGRLSGGARPARGGHSRPGKPPIFRRKFERFSPGNFFSDFSPVIVDSRWPFLRIIVASHSR